MKNSMILYILILSCSITIDGLAQITAPLKVLAKNPNYFTIDNNKAVYLTAGLGFKRFYSPDRFYSIC